MKKQSALMKIPDNVKSVDTSTQGLAPYKSGLVKFKTISASISTTWAMAATSVAGFIYIPESNGFYSIPVVSSVLGGTLMLFLFISYFGDEIPSRIPKELRDLAKTSPQLESKASAYTLKNEGVKIQSWTASSAAGTIHFLLPFRIFRKIKMHESITYYPHDDKYVKQTHYLTFNRWIRRKETFEGHRAVFKKAINSF